MVITMKSETMVGTGKGLRAEVLGDPETFYRTVLENLSEGVLITDAGFRICYANRLMTEITGYETEELIGHSPHGIFGSESQKGTCASKNPLPDKAETAEFEMKRKDGELHWVHLKTTPYRDQQGQIVGTIVALSCIERQKTLELENEVLQDEMRVNFGNIIGESPALQKVLTQIATVAPTEANVLVLGESGTGKELVARAIHDFSGRKEHPLVRVNCASIPKELFESEFFGHARGAFTGAIKDRMGRFELADGGTLFLDEIGEIPPDLQSKLLRVLQEGQFERLGEDRTRTVKVRIIAATNRDLLTEAKAGRFRLDLYYRLSVFPIELPPLRERPEDIGALADHFLKQSARRLGVPRLRLTRLHVQDLQSYDWPGNVRELQNVIERAVILGRGGKLQFDLTKRTSPKEIAGGAAPDAEDDGELSLDELVVREREIVAAALRRTNGKIYGTEGAAALLRIKPTTLVSKMKRLNVTKI
ncbi:MAG: sigma54 specific transcriptional regulator with sensor, Fis family [Pedosphaera sp.]|nr:sigma54 specific transcriptional regulator with sensor, Fis family [Pedosphaera sp.]